MSDPRFEVITAEGNTLRLVGELDMETVAIFEEAVAEMAMAEGGLTLDLAGLSFIDSCGFHAFLRQAQALNGSAPLVLVNTPSFMRRPFEVIGLDKHEAVRLT